MFEVSEEPISLGACLARLAETKAEQAAVTCRDQTLTWRELDVRTNRMARGLAARGVRFGDFVTLALRNSVGFVEACWACWKLGATPQPVSAQLPAAELSAIVALANPPLIVAEEDTEPGHRHASTTELLDASHDESPLPDRISPSWKAPTSGGSTGRPKLIVAGQPGLATDLNISFWRVRRDDIALMPGPMYHNGPFASAFAAMTAGAHLVMMPRFDAEEVLREVERHKATWIYLVPAMMHRIWRLPDDVRSRYDVSSLHTVWHLAAPCPAWLKLAWIEWLGSEKIWELYGGTESQAGTVISGTEWLTHRGSVGRVYYGQMKVMDAQGNELPAGASGEVYLKRADDAPPTYHYVGAEPRLLGDWESLGDFGWFDSEGYLYLADRRSDMILIGGSNVYPAEVEGALDSHPLVQSSAVIGLPDEEMGSRIHAIIQARPGLDLDDLRQHLARQLVGYKHPRSFELVSEPLRDEAGKVRRWQLRAQRTSGVSKESSRGEGSVP